MGTAKVYLKGGGGGRRAVPLSERQRARSALPRLSAGPRRRNFLCLRPGPIEEGSLQVSGRGGRQTPAAAEPSSPGSPLRPGGGRRAEVAPGAARPPIGRRRATPLYRETRLAAWGGPCPRAGFVRRAACRSFNNGRRERPGAGPELRRGLRGRPSAA